MKVSTKTQTSTATTVALSIAIGAAAAFAAISLNNAIKQNYNPLINIPVKSGPTYTREMCQNDCYQAYNDCRAKSGKTNTCDKSYTMCTGGCSAYPSGKAVGYVVTPETTPGYMVVPEKKPPVTPGYNVAPVIPPTVQRLPPWVSNDNPPDPKIINPAIKQPAKK